ncbi:universal stress protein [Mangrovimonas aestuarii]|uniref:universal stress protein n=1 Tax=Mangrovimonas aestuarii TaxID=3018443 RepID=UPI0023789EDF|nr:universal stress protein [Mangrovimonas aestuarii]
MKKIVVPTDFSENAFKAVVYAKKLFENEPCTFYLLHAYEVSPSHLSSTVNKAKGTRLFRAIEEQATSEMDRLFKKMVSENKNELHVFEKKIFAESLVNAIGRTVIDKNVDYIFMGTKGASGMKEIFIGSNTVNIVKSINFCPVVAVPQGYDFKVPEVILFPTDFRRAFEDVEIKPLKGIAKLWNSKVKVLYVTNELSLSEEQQKNKNVLEKLLGDFDLSEERIDKHGSIAAAINHFSQNQDIGMVTMINTQHSFTENLLREKVVKHVAFKVEKPLLIIPEIK